MTRRGHLLKTLRAIRVGLPDVHSANLHQIRSRNAQGKSKDGMGQSSIDPP